MINTEVKVNPETGLMYYYWWVPTPLRPPMHPSLASPPHTQPPDPCSACSPAGPASPLLPRRLACAHLLADLIAAMPARQARASLTPYLSSVLVSHTPPLATRCAHRQVKPHYWVSATAVRNRMFIM